MVPHERPAQSRRSRRYERNSEPRSGRDSAISTDAKAGRVNVPDKQVALFAAGGGLLAVMRAVLDGQAPRNADRHHAEGVLRLFGLEPEDAAEVGRRPMPKIPPGPR